MSRVTQEELKEIEQGLYDRLTAPASGESSVDLVDYATRNLQRLISAHRVLLKQAGTNIRSAA